MDTAIHKGRPFWSGVFDANDGFIREVHPYKRAKAADFHHSYYVSSQSQDAMKQGDAGFFWVDPDGSVNTDWREGSAPKHIVDAIQDQIEPIPHKDNGGSVGHIENHSSAIAEAMQNHFGVPVSVSKSKTPYGESHYVKPQFDLPKGETPFTVRVSDHAAWVPRLHQIEHQVYPKKGDDPEKFINESIDAAKKYGQRVGLFSKDEFVPLKGEVYHPAFGKGTIVDSQPDSAKVDFGDKGVKNISSRFLQEVPHKDNGGGITALQREEVMDKNRNLAKWFGNSKIVDDSGQPLIAYKAMQGVTPHIHPDSGMTHVALDPDVAQGFANGDKIVHQVYVKSENPFDFRNPNHVNWISNEIKRNPHILKQFNKQTQQIMGPDYNYEANLGYLLHGIHSGAYQTYEVPVISNMIKNKGHDGIYMVEEGEQHKAPNLAVFHPHQIKSATDNDTFDERYPSIHKDNGGGITAYHGGPHFVGEESFLDEKIGTGEGAQAYGHGHYFAENEDVAKGYRDALTDTNPTARHYLNIAQGDQNKALELFDRDTSGSSSPQIEETKKHIQGQKGHMYEVHIDAHPDHFLDWDQPIHNQTKHVQNALSGLNLSAGKYGDTPLGAHIYGELAHKFDQHDPEMLNAVRDHPNQLAEAPELASALLHSKGIHGIKYLDAGSRSKGEGTRNYVVFDPKRVDIKRRYEQGGAASSPVKKNLI